MTPTGVKPHARVNPPGDASASTAASGPHLRGLEKLPKEGRFLFVCNHRSLFDPLMVMGYLADWNIAFISKPSNMRIPLAGDLAYAAGFLAIDRENDRAALKTILTAADYMKRDLCSIGIYPEGTRTAIPSRVCCPSTRAASRRPSGRTSRW